MDDKLGSDQLAKLLEAEYGLAGCISRLAGESDNFLIETGEARYVLKLCTETQSTAVLDLEWHAVETVAVAGLGLDLPRIVPTRRGGVEARYDAGGSISRGRLLRFVEGLAWNEAGAASVERLRDLGRRIASIVSALSVVDHPAARRTHLWDLAAAASHRPKIRFVEDPARRQVLDQAYTLFVEGAEPFLAALPSSLIHGDLNDENVLVGDVLVGDVLAGGDRVTGVLDFGDCLHNPTICELAIALAYLLFDEAEPLQAGAEVVAGYHAQCPLTAREAEMLFPLICGRLAASVSIAAHRRQLDPERAAWFATEQRAWRALEKYVRIDPINAAEQLASSAKIPVYAERARRR